MQTWLQNLVAQWHSTSQWEVYLTEYLQSHEISSPETILEKLQYFRNIPTFSEQGRRILPVILISGDIATTLQRLQDFCIAFEQKTRQYFDFARPFVPAFLHVIACSEFLTRRLIRRPEVITNILEAPYLEMAKPLNIMKAELHRRFYSLGEMGALTFKNELRRYKYEEYIRITMRDLGGLGVFPETLEELSSVAIACLQMATMAAEQVILQDGTIRFSPDSAEKEHMLPLAVLGMGKLGGYELNYSSDIDLIFLFNEKRIQAGHPFHSERARQKLARCLIELMGQITEEGFVTRVDMRLRPGGDQAPLTRSLAQAENYYASQGELWERQALIKAAPVAGDIQSGQQFLKTLAPFIYSKLIDENMLGEIQRLKERIEKEHLKQHLNVKLGVGGIREIEFFVQIFQLLYGGTRSELRRTNTLRAIEQLHHWRYLPTQDATILQESYIYLRKLEHRLQMEQEHQTHTIPGERFPQRRLARWMGYDEEELATARRHLLQDVKDVMVRVRSIFGALFSSDHLEIAAAIRNNISLHQIPGNMQTIIDNSARQFNAVVRQSDQDILHIRFQRLFESIRSHVHYYEHLLKFPASVQRLARIGETSEFLWNYLLSHLDLLKQLDATEVLHTRSEWEAQLDSRLAKTDDIERQLDILREFKHEVTFLIGSAELDGILPYEHARLRLTTLAEVVLQAAYDLVLQEFVQRFGKPCSDNKPVRFAILGLGKMGGYELTYHSDLDLIFIYSESGSTDGERSISNHEYYIKLIQRLISVLSTFTRSGYAYKLDTRLRPSGNAGVLVTSFQAYLTYHETSLPWEHQALIKGRVVGGDMDSEWVQAVESGITQAVYDWQWPEDLNQQIHHLRQRKEKEQSIETERVKNLKEGFGGLLDIEYLIQYLQLRHGREMTELRTPKTLDALDQFAKKRILASETVHSLSNSYKFLRLLESYLRLLFDKSTASIDFDTLKTETLINLLHLHGYAIDEVYDYYQETTLTIRNIYKEAMGI